MFLKSHHKFLMSEVNKAKILEVWKALPYVVSIDNSAIFNKTVFRIRKLGKADPDPQNGSRNFESGSGA